MKLFKEAGAKYIMPVAKHHDGFQMYASELSAWNAAAMGPKRDIVGERKEAAEREGAVGNRPVGNPANHGPEEFSSGRFVQRCYVLMSLALMA